VAATYVARPLELGAGNGFDERRNMWGRSLIERKMSRTWKWKKISTVGWTKDFA
jgi:hypothetical protein